MTGVPTTASAPHHHVCNRPGMAGSNQPWSQKADVLGPGFLRPVKQSSRAKKVIGVEPDVMSARDFRALFGSVTGHEYGFVIRYEASVKEGIDGMPVPCWLLIMDVKGAITAEVPGEAGLRHEYNRLQGFFSEA